MPYSSCCAGPRTHALTLSLLAVLCAPVAAQTRPVDSAETPASDAAPPAPRTIRDAAALQALEQRLARDSGDDDAYRLRALTLADLGSSMLAAEAVAARPDLFATHQIERIEGDAIARQIGWGRVEPETPAQRLDEAEAALEALRTLQRESPRQTNWERTRLRVDALSALNRLQRHQEVVDGYDALLAEGIDVPAYALGTVGDSLLALRRPEDASRVLEAAVEHQPDDVNARILLAYAWMEQERFDLAMPLFESLAASQPAWPRQPGARTGYENWDRYSADVNLALAHSYANDQARAEAMLQALGHIGPANPGLQAAIGAVEARRRRPAAALERYGMALTADPQDRDALAGRVGALTALDRIDAARDAYAVLDATYPDDPRLVRIEDALDRHRGVQATLSANRGRSRARDGGSPQSPFGSRDGGYALDVRSPLLDDRWRVGVLAQDTWADFGADTQAARTRYRSVGVGGYYRHDRLGASATVSRVSDADDRGAIAWTVAGDWRASDAWRIGAAVARLDPQASLQARRLGITADSLTLSAAWTPSDTVGIDARVARLRYEDGNRRDQLGIDATRRLLSRPHLMIDGLASVYAGRASQGDRTAYFNPERDASATLGLRADHITWRRYETAFQQRVQIAAGPYWQRGQAMHWVPSLGYRHLWRRDGHELEYGVAWSRPVYDGAREQRIAFDVELRWGGAR
ncbi:MULTISPECIES: poly-beta-1,6 N-acetyl-D-glucosamine export porin PgaA [Luteimonas]|uniref:poly-beta-1,6 N-acetyl-D-glucosamine export porin PgaA n=1 Tax=Luteimonas TaxID=83614 RepID=UPI001E4886D7|nr:MULTISPECIES: poly-beta-1,6 N-acetyl-D-glucosamine export porin PgaA [Luteimonas]